MNIAKIDNHFTMTQNITIVLKEAILNKTFLLPVTQRLVFQCADGHNHIAHGQI